MEKSTDQNNEKIDLSETQPPKTVISVARPSNKKRNIIIISIVAFVVLLGVGLTIFLIMQNSSDDDVADQGADTSQDKKSSDDDTDSPTYDPNASEYPETSDADRDKIAAELYTKAEQLVIDLALNNACTYGWDASQGKEGFQIVNPVESKTVNGRIFTKTTERYDRFINKTFSDLIDPVRTELISRHYLNVDGVLYCRGTGASGADIVDVKVSLQSQQDGKYVYKATYRYDFCCGDEPNYSDTFTSNFTIQKVGPDWKISHFTIHDWLPE